MQQAFVFHGIACCVTHLYVLFLWQQITFFYCGDSNHNIIKIWEQSKFRCLNFDYYTNQENKNQLYLVKQLIK